MSATAAELASAYHQRSGPGPTRLGTAGTPGRKRGLAVDVLGLITGVVVLAASAHDNAGGRALLDQAAERCGTRLEKALVDQGFKDEVVIHGAMLDITVDVVRRNLADQAKGFVPQEEMGGGASQRHVDVAPASGPRVRPPARQCRLTRLLGIHREHGPPPHDACTSLAR